MYGKQRALKTKKSSNKIHGGHETKDLMIEQKKDGIDTPREEKQKGHETCNSASSTCSNVKPMKHEENLRASFSLILRSNSKIIARTEAHPNATQNIQNFTLLQASITDIMKNNFGNPQYRRSISTLDFGTLDPEKISKLFGVE
ncbi:hypothetical protein REPUB_Repub10bG0089300 [Reevesia pubescens]